MYAEGLFLSGASQLTLQGAHPLLELTNLLVIFISQALQKRSTHMKGVMINGSTNLFQARNHILHCKQTDRSLKDFIFACQRRSVSYRHPWRYIGTRRDRGGVDVPVPGISHGACLSRPRACFYQCLRRWRGCRSAQAMASLKRCPRPASAHVATVALVGLCAMLIGVTVVRPAL